MKFRLLLLLPFILLAACSRPASTNQSVNGEASSVSTSFSNTAPSSIPEAKDIATFSYESSEPEGIKVTLTAADGIVIKQATLHVGHLFNAGIVDPSKLVQYSTPTGKIVYETINKESYTGALYDPSISYCRMIYTSDFAATPPMLIFGDSDCGQNFITAGQFIVHPTRPLVLVTIPGESLDHLEIVDLTNSAVLKTVSVPHLFDLHISIDGTYAYSFSGGATTGDLVVINLDSYTVVKSTLDYGFWSHAETANISPDMRWMVYPFGLLALSKNGVTNVPFLEKLSGYDVNNINMPWSLDSRYVYFQARTGNEAIGIVYDTAEQKIADTISMGNVLSPDLSGEKSLLHTYRIYLDEQPIFKM